MLTYFKEKIESIRNNGIQKTFTWFVQDVKTFSFCLKHKQKFEKLEVGTPVYMNKNSHFYRFYGIYRYGLSDGMLPQFSVVLEETVKDEDGEFNNIFQTSPYNVHI